MNLPRLSQQFPLACFFVLAYGWTWVCWGAMIAGTRGQLRLYVPSESLATLGQFGPFVAAVVVLSISEGRSGLRVFWNGFGRWRAGPVWVVVSLLLLPATMLVAIYAYGFFYGATARFPVREHWSTLPLHFIYSLMLGGPLGEEPGWRGFALPRLQTKYGPIFASVFLGLLSAGWHLPLWWIFPAPTPFPVFVVSAVLMNFLFTWLFNHTRESVLFSLVFHTSLTVASLRLPDAPAHGIWLAVLVVLILGVIAFDRRLGRTAIDPTETRIFT